MVARIKLPHNETRQERRYSMPDPDALYDAYTSVRKWHYLASTCSDSAPYHYPSDSYSVGEPQHATSTNTAHGESTNRTNAGPRLAVETIILGALAHLTKPETAGTL